MKIKSVKQKRSARQGHSRRVQQSCFFVRSLIMPHEVSFTFKQIVSLIFTLTEKTAATTTTTMYNSTILLVERRKGREDDIKINIDFLALRYSEISSRHLRMLGGFCSFPP